MTAPSGQQAVLRHGDQTAVVVEVGGGLRSYVVGDRPVLDGYAEDEMASGGRGQPLLPWPNRLAGGRYTFDGAAHQADLSEPAAGNAIHGLTRWRNWSFVDADGSSVSAEHSLLPSPAYPWSLDLAIAYRLDDGGLTVGLSATNRSASPAPWAAGFHPYLAAPSGAVNDLALTVPADQRYLADDHGIPTGTEAVEGGAYDFRAGAPIGDAVLDTCFTGLTRGSDGRARVEVSGTTLWVDEAWTHLMVFTGDTLSADRRRRGLAVEPMTAPADAFNSGVDLRVLEPGERFGGSWGIVPGSL